MRVLITDLDNTLYDWVTFFAHAFQAMTRELVALLGAPEDQILDQFKAVHRRYGNSEQPFAVLELPCVLEKYGDLPRNELRRLLDPPLRAFNEARDQHLRLYPGVKETLTELQRLGVMLIGHTEAIGVNAYYRLKRLNIVEHFKHLYVLHGRVLPHPDPSRESAWSPPASLLREVPLEERKPNPKLLLDICAQEGVSPEDACYVGDSIARDVMMAKSAGLPAAWARYGTVYDQSLWPVLVRVTHWTDEDVAREAELKKRAAHVKPDFVLDSFSDLLPLAKCEALKRPRSSRPSAD